MTRTSTTLFLLVAMDYLGANFLDLTFASRAEDLFEF
jgi:hypothetical protein